MTGKAMLDRFSQRDPLAVMTRAIVTSFLGERLSQLFTEHRGRQYQRAIEFSTLAVCMAEIALGTLENRNQAYAKYKEELATSATAFYGKLNRTSPQLSEAIVSYSAEEAFSVFDHLGYQDWEILEGFRVLALDGNHLQKTEKRLKEARGLCAAPLPGTVVARFDLQKQMFDRAYLLEDAHAQETVILDRVAEDLGKDDLVVADRNFCVTEFMRNLMLRGASFVIRQNGRLKGKLLKTRRKIGRCGTGMVYEQELEISKNGYSMIVRRITVELDRPTRDGDTVIHVLTNVPARLASAIAIADTYLRRWEIENAFYHLTTTLTCELKGNCHPRCALFLFCMAMFAYNCRQVLIAALYAVHDQEEVDQISHFKVAKAIQLPMPGMLTAINETEWHRLTPHSRRGLANFLLEVSGYVRLDKYRKSVRGPKKPPPKRKRCKKGTHLSAYRLLNGGPQTC
ncbi:MAG TPA: transposase [Nannocystis exedens]|nr:transposase [Nannocystis exedens]